MHDYNLLVGWTAGSRSPKALAYRSTDESALDNAFAAKRSGRVFYKELWTTQKRLIPVIFHEGFTFRGSLGPTLVGHDDFVTETFGQYTTDILAMIEKGNRVGGKMHFYGFSSQGIVRVLPSGRHVWWIGMPIFTFRGDQGTSLFVLGDVHSLLAD